MCRMMLKRKINERKGLERNMEDGKIRTCGQGKLLEVTFGQRLE